MQLLCMKAATCACCAQDQILLVPGIVFIYRFHPVQRTCKCKYIKISMLFSGQEVHQILGQLTRCIVRRKVSMASLKEKAWRNFFNVQASVSSSLDALIDHPGLASFIVLKSFEHLITLNFHTSPSSSTPKPTPITDEEHDILVYVGGFILFRCRKFFATNDLCLSLVNNMMKSVGEAFKGKLITIKSRGGLCEPTEKACTFFISCENLFRELFVSFESVHSLTVECFVAEVYKRENILFEFHDCTSHSSADISAQETLLLKILQLFFFTRCQAECRQFFEKYLAHKKSIKKKKALRKEIESHKE